MSHPFVCGFCGTPLALPGEEPNTISNVVAITTPTGTMIVGTDSERAIHHCAFMERGDLIDAMRKAAEWVSPKTAV